MNDVPVYLFVGFLESGKTKFIQETLMDAEFNDGENILVLVFEEGMEEYDPGEYPSKNVFFKFFDSKEEMTKVNLQKALREHDCTRVVVEYNGVWLLDDLLEVMPKKWAIYQMATFADANTFPSYNANMRQLVYDKLNGSSLVVFNRCSDSTDKLELHKIVRAANRVANIIYEDENGDMEYDEFEDPLPYDLEAPIVEIGDRDYAWFYQDISENSEKYYGKTLRFSGYVRNNMKLPNGAFLFGRQMMTCCEADIGFAGFMCAWKDAGKLKNGQWLTIDVLVNEELFDAIGDDLKILQVVSATKRDKVVPEVATFE